LLRKYDNHFHSVVDSVSKNLVNDFVTSFVTFDRKPLDSSTRIGSPLG
jgi:hypothetical protein